MSGDTHGYESGPDASIRAAASAWARVPDARAVVLVEGVSDQAAVEATARAHGRDLDGEAVVVLPMGGAQALRSCLVSLLDSTHPPTVAGLCDAPEEPVFRRAVAAAGLARPTDRAQLAASGFFVCVDDLEDELVRAAGQTLVEAVVDVEGDRRAFDTMRAQPAWRGAPFAAQVRRFIGAGARRKLRYAVALADAVAPERTPAPLVAVLTRVAP